MVTVVVSDQQQDLQISSAVVVEVVKEVLRFEKVECHEVYVHFVDSRAISQLHKRYFDDPEITDCISFPIDEDPNDPYRVLGEVFVCPAKAIEYAASHPQTSPEEETTLYIVHGLLHLLGYDDQGDKEPEMREQEKLHMKNLKQHNLLLVCKG